MKLRERTLWDTLSHLLLLTSSYHSSCLLGLVCHFLKVYFPLYYESAKFLNDSKCISGPPRPGLKGWKRIQCKPIIFPVLLRTPYRKTTTRKASSPDPQLSHVAGHGRCWTSCFGPPCCFHPSSTLLVEWLSAAPHFSSLALSFSSS